MGSMDLYEARIAMRFARRAIEIAVNSRERIKAPEGLPAVFEDLAGVFVTLNSGGLRGCVGYPYPNMTLKDALIDAAISAALHDYRFPPVRADELPQITIELTLLSKPNAIAGPSDITVGKHGLIVKKGAQQGLLLPQVATDYGWTPEEFLDQTYIKAGLIPRDERVEIFVFEGQIFSELSPGGDVVERRLE
ncbi:MAG TPA: TIGR00296 family protein [Candidatus Bathyarchaeia archaeon]|nr:TIGR00296 family protein [Candidatus Bathyarchaeia archaeon]